MPDDSSDTDPAKDHLLRTPKSKTQESRSTDTRLDTQIDQEFSLLAEPLHIHTPGYFQSIESECTGAGDTARCQQCGLEISNRTLDMNPFTIHSTEKPNCSFNLSLSEAPAFPTTTSDVPMANEQENSSTCLSIQTDEPKSSLDILSENDLRQQVRIRTFSHWPHQIPSSEKMIEAGFFKCNVDDRVICIYCNLICHQWTHTDDPCEIHRTLSSDCIYVKTSLAHREAAQIINNNGILTAPTTSSFSSVSNDINSLTTSQFVLPFVESNTTSANLSGSPSIDDTIEDLSENPVIDHAMRFPDCHYVQQLSGIRMYQRIQEANQAQQARDELLKRRIICKTWSNGLLYNWGLNGNSMIEHAGCFPYSAYIKQLYSDKLPRKIQEFKQKQQVRDTLPKRLATFLTWPNENLPPVNDFVRAGFFYTGTESIVTCFYCNGSIQNWSAYDNPFIEHARWFPNCAYAKQLCGDELYRKIQESKRVQLERARVNEMKDKAASGATSNTNTTTNSRQLLIPDKNTLAKMVAARAELPISQDVLKQKFESSIIKQCWEDQLRLKKEDFVSYDDLLMACTILQKQAEHLNGNKENIIIPNIKMKQIREENQQATHSQFSTTTTSSTDDHRNQSSGSIPSNLCIMCSKEEKQLACLPCGHLAVCVPCSPPLRSCPACDQEIKSFVRVYTKP